jgi:hypothetical protein
MIMSKPLALLTVMVLAGLAILAPRQYSAAQATIETPEATMAATEPVIQISDSLALDSKFSDEEIDNPKLSVTVSKPVLVGKQSPAVDGFNKAVDEIVQDVTGSFKKDYGTLDPSATLPPEIAKLGSYVDVGYEVLEADPALISIKFVIDWYGAGAAHPNSYSISLNYDLNKGRVLKLADLFKPDADYLKVLADYSTKTLQAAGRLDFPEGAEPKEENYRSWNVTKYGLQINFDDYQVTPHAVGPQEVLIPYSLLKPIINPDGPLAPFAG